MARDQVDMTPLATRDEIVARPEAGRQPPPPAPTGRARRAGAPWLEPACKPKAQFRVGTEHEKFAFTVADHRPVPYSGKRSIHSLLDGMHELLGRGAILEGRHLLAPSDGRRGAA